MDVESQQFNKGRSERIRLLRERQSRELEDFDAESTRMGFSSRALAEPPQELYPDDESELSASMLSLSMAQSSTSASVFTHHNM